SPLSSTCATTRCATFFAYTTLFRSALVDDDEVVDEAFDEVELMAGEEHRGTGGGEGAEHVEGAFDGGGVEPGERLVEDEDLRVVDEGGGDLDLLLVTEADRFE